MLRFFVLSLLVLICACNNQSSTTNGSDDDGVVGEPVGRVLPHELTISDKAVDIIGAGAHIFAHLDDNRIKCWGENDDGQCNLKKARNVSKKFYDVRNARFSKLSTSDFFSCGILKEEGFDGIPLCFGRDGEWLDVPHEKVTDIACGPDFTCFVKEDGKLGCVGKEIELLSKTGASIKINPADLSKHGVSEGVENIDYSQKIFKNIKNGGFRICAQDVDGFVFCMGTNVSNKGSSIKERVTEYSVDMYHTLFILEDGKLAEAGVKSGFNPIQDVTDPSNLKYKKILGPSTGTSLLTASGNFYSDGSSMPANTLLSYSGDKEEGVLAAASVNSSRRIGSITILCMVKANHKILCRPEARVKDAANNLDNPILKDLPQELAY